uniref:Uncharacterized protein n=1 Tax=Amphimedon queenslandica TaxID=400682 RepID=A0A1X7UYN1_AMPQE
MLFIFLVIVPVICKRNVKKDNAATTNITTTTTTNNPVIYDIPTDTVQFSNVSVSMEENAAYGSANVRGVVYT